LSDDAPAIVWSASLFTLVRASCSLHQRTCSVKLMSMPSKGRPLAAEVPANGAARSSACCCRAFCSAPVNPSCEAAAAASPREPNMEPQ
jgi:hypothetical protein